MHTAMEPLKRTMPTFVLLLLGSISTNVHADITKTPTSGVFLEGSDVTLTCVVEGNGNVIWEDFSNATSIFVGKEKNTEKNKYDNFEISSGDGDFSLIIKDVQLSDEGTYVCKDRDRLAKATVSIGVLPYVYLSVKQSEAIQAPHTSTKVNITCSAYKARPAVSVFELSVVGGEKTVNITNDKSNQNEDGKTYNSSASVSYIMSSEEMSVYCRVFTAGRSLILSENFNIPRCNITISGNEIRCSCQANPPVNTYYIDVNGNKHDGDVLSLEEVEPMNMRCFATNELGTGQSDRLFPDDMHSSSISPSNSDRVSCYLTGGSNSYLHQMSTRSEGQEIRREHIPPGNEGNYNINDSSFPKTDLTSDLKEAAQENESTNISSSGDILVSCGIRIGKVGIKKLLEAFGEKDIETEDGATILKKLEQKNVIRKPYVNLLRQLTKCKIYGARKILLFNFETDLQQLKATIRNQLKNDWEIFAIEILDIPEELVEDAVITTRLTSKMEEPSERRICLESEFQYRNHRFFSVKSSILSGNNKYFIRLFVDQIEVVIREITAEHIGMMDDIITHNKLEKIKVLSEFNLQSVEEEGRYYFKNMESTQSEKSSNENIICKQDPPTIESRERLGKVGIRRLLAAMTKCDIETEDETNVLEKLDKDGVINKDCANLLSNLSDCKLFRARKIVIAYLEADLWNYITNSICPQISLDWEIFAVDVLKLHPRKVVYIIEHTKDENGQVLSMFRKWRYACGHETQISTQFLLDLINASEISSEILSKDNRPNNLKGKPTNEGGCSDEFLEMLTHLSKRIGVFGRKRLEEIKSKGVKVKIFGPPEEIPVDDSVNSLGQLCFMLYEANLFTARDVVITYIEKQLHEVIATISKVRASDWDELAWYGLHLSGNDVAYLERAAESNEGK
ncbi:putative irregular chiasm C-roughest protein-like [Apostichopus japonicus]|uniref:Putative irregular chiasm C-roughest protein-like n=1 Tax=Stichopus japonicus TaxID=307972 RepID=A0A2G8KLV7_STIJA|nr:putative irregular chiasm C-roughest protein-like [Apostichopus japonicus]